LDDVETGITRGFWGRSVESLSIVVEDVGLGDEVGGGVEVEKLESRIHAMTDLSLYSS
jgi:hypothetical protein